MLNYGVEQVYDLGDPWAQVGDGNPRKINRTSGQVIGLRCCGNKDSRNQWGNCSSPENGGTCPDKYNCSLPMLGPGGEDTAEYGPQCAAWNESEWAPLLRPLAKLVRANNPAGLAGNNFVRVITTPSVVGACLATLVWFEFACDRLQMGGIHPRLKR